MEMSQIRYVLAGSQTLNFTRAAEACNVSQPALTKGIKALEAELGAPLFLREGRRVLLSEFGRTMLPHLRQIVEEADAARTLAENYRLLDKPPLRLGVLSTIGHVRLARFLARLESAHAGIELAVSEGSLAHLREELGAGRLDAAILTATEDLADVLRLQQLYEERYVVVMPSQHRLRAMNAIRLEDLKGEDYVDRLSCEMREMVMQVCETEGVELYARFRSEREDWVQAMVIAGIGFAFMPEYSVSLSGLVQRPLIEPEVTRRVALATVPGRKHAPVTAALVRAAQGYAWPG
jgi:DNA-binding transcriptional LysR family regulator